MGWSQARTTRLGAKFSLDIDSLFEENTLEKRVLVSKHQTLIGSRAVSRLEVVEVGLMDADGLFELLYVFSSAFTKSSLSLSVPLLSFYGSRIDLFMFC